jgi:hypothetical protein
LIFFRCFGIVDEEKTILAGEKEVALYIWIAFKLISCSTIPTLPASERHRDGFRTKSGVSNGVDIVDEFLVENNAETVALLDTVVLLYAVTGLTEIE